MRQLSSCCVIHHVDHSDDDAVSVLLGFNHKKGGWENCGGRNEGNELAHETARREMREETGIDPDKDMVHLLQADNYEGDDGWFCVVFHAHSFEKYTRPVPEPENHREWRWFTLKELKAIEPEMTPACRNILRSGGYLV